MKAVTPPASNPPNPHAVFLTPGESYRYLQGKRARAGSEVRRRPRRRKTRSCPQIGAGLRGRGTAPRSRPPRRGRGRRVGPTRCRTPGRTPSRGSAREPPRATTDRTPITAGKRRIVTRPWPRGGSAPASAPAPTPRRSRRTPARRAALRPLGCRARSPRRSRPLRRRPAPPRGWRRCGRRTGRARAPCARRDAGPRRTRRHRGSALARGERALPRPSEPPLVDDILCCSGLPCEVVNESTGTASSSQGEEGWRQALLSRSHDRAPMPKSERRSSSCSLKCAGGVFSELQLHGVPRSSSAERTGRGRRMIFSKQRDLRLVTVRRGGTLQDADHHHLAVWAADCAEHVLPYFERVRPGDDRPRRATELARAWARGEITMTQARTAAFSNAAAREVSGAAKQAALAAAQAVAVAHVPAHELGAAAYAIRAARMAAP